MSTTDEEKERLIEQEADILFGEIILTCHLTVDELLERLERIFREKGGI